MSLGSIFGKVATNRFPRVSGDEPSITSFSPSLATFSPRERG